VVIKAAIVSDIGDWPVGFDQQARGGGEPRLHNELVWSDTKNPLNKPSEADWRQTGTFCEDAGGDWFIAVGFKVFECAGEAGRNALAVTRRTQISGDSNYTDDYPVVIAHRKFRR
jgi:hypothetical protein